MKTWDLGNTGFSSGEKRCTQVPGQPQVLRRASPGCKNVNNRKFPIIEKVQKLQTMIKHITNTHKLKLKQNKNAIQLSQFQTWSNAYHDLIFKLRDFGGYKRSIHLLLILIHSIWVPSGSLSWTYLEGNEILTNWLAQCWGIFLQLEQRKPFFLMFRF